jgi:hypothetical protein
MANRSSSALSWVPRGVRLEEAAFATRHRMLTVVALAHVPVLVAVAVWLDSTSTSLWLGLGAIVVACLVATGESSQAARSTLVGFALVMTSTYLVYVADGLTDMHIHFYVMLALIALYQSWSPFLLAIAMVAGHHFVLGTIAPDTVFSEAGAQEDPLGFALLHAGLLLAMAVALAVGWRFAEDAEAARRLQQRRAEERALAEAAAQAELAEERARTAATAAEQLAMREHKAAELTQRLAVLEQAGDRLTTDVGTATAEMDGLLSSIRDIALAANHASTTANDAGSEVGASAAAMERLTGTLSRIQQIAHTITGIADQTNLLALNATIEAARANEAGKGFAVVASEVKNLAQETAEATARIRDVVSTVQSDTVAAMDSIGRIRGVMAEVVDAQQTIAAAVEQQTAATTQARHAIESAAGEADRMAADLRSVTTLQP